LGDLPAGLIFDVLVVPGSEQLSTVLEMEPVVQHEEEEREKVEAFSSMSSIVSSRSISSTS